MAFTNTYDVTFPADTQLANLLGSDLRALALNVQQRMAVISGLDAAKPNFAGDAQPANWNGILFFATDTGKIYQFNNPSWTAITGSFIPAATAAIRNNASVTNTGNTTNNTIYTLAVPGGSMGANGIIRVTVPFEFNYSANSANIQLLLGASVIVGLNVSSAWGPTNQGFIEAIIRNVAATNSQRTSAWMGINNVGIEGNASVTSAIDTTSAQNIVLKCQNVTTAGNSTTFRGISAQYL